MEAGRIANVSAAVTLGRASPAEVRAWTALLERIFEDVAAIAETDPDRGLARAIEGASGERVVVVDAERAPAPAEAILALVAWPERTIVRPLGAGGRACAFAIYACDVLRARAADWLAQQAAGGIDGPGGRLLDGVEIESIPFEGLGLGAAPAPFPGGGQGA